MKRISLAILVILSAGLPVTAQTREPLIIALLPEATVDQTMISLDQIARISGGSLELKRQVAKLDIAELRFGTERIVVSSDNVRFRLLLAGLAAADFHLVGAKRTTVTESDEPISLRKIGAAAEMVVRQKYPGDVSGVFIAPLKGIVIPPLAVRPTDRIRFESRTLAQVPLAGKARTEVTVLVNDVPRAAVPVTIEIRLPEIVSLPLEVKQKQPYIRPVVNLTPKVEAKTLIKSGDRIKIVAPLGTARIEVLGEAMGDGALGEIIRVRNVESNRVVHGRIESGGIVVVDY